MYPFILHTYIHRNAETIAQKDWYYKVATPLTYHVNTISVSNTNMASSNSSDEKTHPKTEMVDGVPESFSNSESDDLAMLALQKRVLRKTDMVVLPMVTLPMQLLALHTLTITVALDVLRLFLSV
jgi:hypothetical protein